MNKSRNKLSGGLGKLFINSLTLSSVLIASQSGFAGPMHAYFADEHNTSPTTPTGNRILEIDVDNMSLVNSLDVPGILGHHADNGFNSKIYGVPKGSGFVNVIDLRKDSNGTTSMNNSQQIPLTHMPRSGDAYNDKYKIILMAASNRPMGSFINVETDEVVGTIGENVDCTLDDGSQLLSHADANTIAGATKYQCTSGTHGGTQVSGHPYWLTSDIAAVIDRTNNQISTYRVQQVGTQITATLLNHLPTRTSIHQIVNRDRTSLPGSQQADFYAIEEGSHVNGDDYSVGVPHALLKLKLTTAGLTLDRRMDLQRTQIFSKTKADRILQSCITIYRSTFNQALTGPSRERERRYNTLFAQEGINRSTDQDVNNDFPLDCFFPGIPGGHNGDFAPNNKHLYVGMAGGAMSVIDVDRWKIANTIDIGIRTGPGHMCFSEKNDVALSSNHGFSATFGRSMHRSIRYINSERPIGYYWIGLPFSRENIINTAQSHTCYVDESGDNYYNFFTDGGVFYKIDMAGVFNNPTNGSNALVVDSLYTGGIPIQGSYIDVDDIRSTTPGVQFAANNDTAQSNGGAITVNVLANDTGTGLALEMVDPASNGQVSIVGGQLRYTPNRGYSGTDTIWYGISSTTANDLEWAALTVTVNSSVPPTVLNANKDVASTAATSPVTINLLANDTGIGIRTGWIDIPIGGSIRNANGTITYSPRAGFNGEENFWYELIDSSGQTTWGNVVITVGTTTPQPVVVTARDDTASVARGRTVTMDVIANDTGRSLEIYEVDRPWMGSVRIVNNKLVYTASSNLTGTIDIWYGVKDPDWNDSWAKVTVTVTR
ncbi:MAG: Ig-like domain-containing protein [Cocleimonas sp.]